MQAIGIVGASGYSGEVLLEILSRHPKIGSLVVASQTHAGKRVDSVLPRLAGLVDELTFVEADPQALAAMDVDVWFLALPHGVAARYAMALVGAARIVIDLSADFRLNSAALYEQYYGEPHPVPELLPKVPYVLPELMDEEWKKAQLIACPGCYPTSILMPLIPLFRKGILSGNNCIVVNSMSGVSGAGKKESLFYSYCERSESVVAYGLGNHRHLSEIEEQLELAAGRPVLVQFTPHLVPMMRGIATTIVIQQEVDLKAVYAAWEDAFAGKPCVAVLPAGKTPDTRNLTGRNRVDFSAYKDERTGNLIITSAEDNLVKGASGQAVQIMNLRLGWDESAGLI